ncbi:MAG: IPT/TIG domain-containing protein [Verrucomicrobiota bacterium]
MQNTRLLHASRILRAASAAFGLAALVGCTTPVLTTLTPDSLPENPSQLYTLSLRFAPHAAFVLPDSVSIQIVIDGQPHPMTKSAAGTEIYTYDHQTASGQTELTYYFLASFSSRDQRGVITKHDEYTPLQHAKISGRYVLSLETGRGPVGARIGILGRGFTPQDQISLDNTPARTVPESPTALSFYVPAVPNGRSYQVKITNAAGTTIAGTFTVDASNVTITPTALNLRVGETQTLTFTLPTVAPAGGTMLDVMTDVPNTVMMPEVVIPAGANGVRVQVRGLTPGTGSLFLKGYGSGEVTVPVQVTP